MNVKELCRMYPQTKKFWNFSLGYEVIIQKHRILAWRANLELLQFSDILTLNYSANPPHTVMIRRPLTRICVLNSKKQINWSRKECHKVLLKKGKISLFFRNSKNFKILILPYSKQAYFWSNSCYIYDTTVVLFTLFLESFLKKYKKLTSNNRKIEGFD